jgi:hypothetical protein
MEFSLDSASADSVFSNPPLNTNMVAFTLNESKANSKGNMIDSLFNTSAKITLFLENHFIYKNPSSS